MVVLYGGVNLKTSIQKIVNRLIKKYDTRDPFEICKQLGIWIYIIPLGNTKGYYTYAQRKKVIFINESLSRIEKIIICAHELGHALLHPKGNIYFKKRNTHYVLEKFENSANVFAAELMISENIVEKYPDYYTLQQIAAAESLPIELLELKFKSLGIF